MTGRTYKEYRELLQSLLPFGKFWSRDESATFTELLNGFGDELSRVEGRSLDLIKESTPTRVTELLEEWEADYAIPDAGKDLASTTQGRRDVIYSKFIALGEQDKSYFENIATALGYTITITEIKKSMPGLMEVGEDFVTPEKAIFYWFVDIDVSAAMMEFYTGANITQLIIDIEKRKPAHTIVLFRFTGVGFDSGFDQGFNSIPWYDGSSWPIGFGRGFSNGFANAYDYDGVRLTGGFDSGFSLGFDSHRGGGFNFNQFGDGFSKPT